MKDLEISISRQKLDVDVAGVMDAGLKGDDFDIILLQSEGKQSVSDSAYREWIWQVTPRSSGPHRLLISAQPLIAVDGFGTVATGEPYRDSKDIQVVFNWSYWLGHIWETKGYDILLIGLSIGLGSFVTWFISRRKHARELAALAASKQQSSEEHPKPKPVMIDAPVPDPASKMPPSN